MGNVLTACCSTEKPVFPADVESKDSFKEGVKDMKVEGPDEWTDTSMDWTRTDTSFDNGGERKKGPSFRNMTKQDYLSLYGRHRSAYTLFDF
jgi:hypothetical protein